MADINKKRVLDKIRAPEYAKASNSGSGSKLTGQLLESLSSSSRGEFINNLTSQNGIPGDSPQKLAAEILKMTICGFVMAAALYIVMGNLWIALAIVVLAPFVPFLTRWMAKKEYRAAFTESFNKLINFLILYTSAGMSVDASMEAIASLLQPDDPLKLPLEDIITTKKVEGVAGSSLLSSLERLNAEMKIDEITRFTRNLSLQVERGVPVTKGLFNQLDQIKQKNKMAASEKVAKTETFVTMIKTTVCSFPSIALLIIPPVVSALTSNLF